MRATSFTVKRSFSFSKNAAVIHFGTLFPPFILEKMDEGLGIDSRLAVTVPILRRLEVIGVMAVFLCKGDNIAFADYPRVCLLSGVDGAYEAVLEIIEGGTLTDVTNDAKLFLVHHIGHSFQKFVIEFHKIASFQDFLSSSYPEKSCQFCLVLL